MSEITLCLNLQHEQSGATAEEDGFNLPMGPTLGYLDDQSYDAASASQAIPESNKGFQMLQKMGWKTDTGLGASEDGETTLLSVFKHAYTTHHIAKAWSRR